MNIKKEIIVYTSQETESCGDKVSHPKVYIHIKKDEKGYCPYCNKVFIYRKK